jgi:hypothetical protein
MMDNTSSALFFTQEQIENKRAEFFALADSYFWYYTRYIELHDCESLAKDITCRTPWHPAAATALQKFEECDYDTNYFILNATVRLGKTRLCTALWATWLFGKDPKTKILIVTKQDENKKKIAKEIEAILLSECYQKLFPKVNITGKGVKRIARKDGGVIQFSTSGSNVRGMGFDHVILDDFLDKQHLMESSGVNKKKYLEKFDILLTRKENSLARMQNYIECPDKKIYTKHFIKRNVLLNNVKHNIITLPRNTKYYIIEQRLHPSDLTAFVLNKLKNTKDSDGNHVKYVLLTFPYEVVNNPLTFLIYKLKKAVFYEDDKPQFFTYIEDIKNITKQPGTFEQPNFIDDRFTIGTRLEVLGPKGIHGSLYQTEYLCNPVLETNKLIDYEHFGAYDPKLFSGNNLDKADRKTTCFFITTDFALSDYKKSDSSVFCLWAVTDNKHNKDKYFKDPKLYLINAKVAKINESGALVSELIDFYKSCELLIHNKKYFSLVANRAIKHVLAEKNGINATMYRQLEANAYLGSRMYIAKFRNKSKKDRLSIATAAIGDRIKQSVFLPKDYCTDVFGNDLQKILDTLYYECLDFNVTNNSHDDILDNVIDAVNYVFSYDKDIHSRREGLTEEDALRKLEMLRLENEENSY